MARTTIDRLIIRCQGKPDVARIRRIEPERLVVG